MMIETKEQLREYYFLLRNLGLDYSSYKIMSTEKRQNLVKSLKNDHLSKFRKEKIYKIFGE